MSTGIKQMIVQGMLPPTSRWKYRGFQFVRLPGMDRTVLTVNCGHSEEDFRECRTYDVEEGRQYRENREYYLKNRDTGELYTTTIGRNPGCTCKSGKVRKRCIHYEVMFAALGEQDNEGLET